MEMLCRGLKTLDELDTTEEAEHLLAAPGTATIRNREPFYNNPSEPTSFGPLGNPSIDFDPSDPL